MESEMETEAESVVLLTCSECSEKVVESEAGEYEILAENCRSRVEQIVCETCISDYYVYSDAHSAYLFEEQAAYCDGDYYFMHEVFCCNSCDEYAHYDNGTATRDGEVCQSCAEDYVYCEDIEELVHYDNASFCEECDVYVANDCENCGCNIYSYSTDVLSVHGYYGLVQNVWTNLQNNKALLLGVELECDKRGNHRDKELAEAVTAAGFDSFGICKRDATVSGIEMVSRPADLESHKSQDWETWLKLLQPIAKGHYAQSAGMHVHVNSHGMSPLLIGKILYFVNASQNRAILETVAQRDLSTHWCEVKPTQCAKVGMIGKTPRLGKYSAVNFTGRTLEFRIFRSTLLPARFYKNLEAVDSIVKFCRQSSARVSELVESNWLKFIEANKPDYPNLHEFIAARFEV